MKNFNYAEYAIGGLRNRNKIFEIDKFALIGKRAECYQSMFCFDEGLKDYVEKTGSVSGYSGLHCADYLYFDFDGQDLNEVKNEVEAFIRFLTRVLEMPDEYLGVYFSGNKGFHLAIPFKAISEPEPSVDFYKTAKRMAERLTEGFKFVDMSIYQINRLLRLENTINEKSGLYKISVPHLHSLLPVDIIRDRAKNPIERKQYPIEEVKTVDLLSKLYNECKQLGAQQKQEKPNELKDIFSGVSEGQRNNAAMKLAGLLVSQGCNETLTLETLKLWNEKNSPPLSHSEIGTVVKSCSRYKKADELPEVYSTASGFEEYKQFVSTFDSVKVNLGFEPLDERIRGILPGEVAVILGKTSVGKSAFLQWIGLNYAKRTKQPVLFFSLEMPMSSVMERSIQMTTGQCGNDVERSIKSGKVTFDREANIQLQKIQSFYTVTKSGIDLEQIKNIIRHCESNVYGQKTGMVLIDYLGLIQGGGRDLYEKTSVVARGIKTIAKELNTPILYLSQISRKNQEKDELDLSSARDSGAVEEAADFVFGLKRQEKGETEYLYILELSILKNRRGVTGRIEIEMDKQSLNFYESIF